MFPQFRKNKRIISQFKKPVHISRYFDIFYYLNPRQYLCITVPIGYYWDFRGFSIILKINVIKNQFHILSIRQEISHSAPILGGISQNVGKECWLQIEINYMRNNNKKQKSRKKKFSFPMIISVLFGWFEFVQTHICEGEFFLFRIYTIQIDCYNRYRCWRYILCIQGTNEF